MCLLFYRGVLLWKLMNWISDSFDCFKEVVLLVFIYVNSMIWMKIYRRELVWWVKNYKYLFKDLMNK